MAKITAEQAQEIATRYERGETAQSLAKAFGVSTETIYWRALKLGADSPRHAKKVLPQTARGPAEMKRGGHVVRRFQPDEDARMNALVASGASVALIARLLGRAPNSVRARLMVLGRQEARREAAELAGG